MTYLFLEELRQLLISATTLWRASAFCTTDRPFTDSDMHSTMSNHMELLEPQLTVSSNTDEITETSECEKQELH